MKSPIILEGQAFDWEEAKKYQDVVVDEAGEVNWMAAMFADPGCMSCPSCREMMWREGTVVRCPYCAHEWNQREREREERCMS